MTFRLAHLSDFHLARPPGRGEWNAKRLLGRINWLLNRRRRHPSKALAEAVDRLLDDPPDAALVTGDLVQTGLASEFDGVGALLAPLARAGVPALLVSGNHDCYGSDASGRDAFARIRRELRLGLAVDALGVLRLPSAGARGGTVEILLMDQGYPCGLLRSNGRLEPGFVARLPGEWPPDPAGPPRLAIGHYPLDIPPGGSAKLAARARGWLGLTGLQNARGLAGALSACGVLAYFCGHLHRRCVFDLSGGVRQYCADSTSRGGRFDRYRLDACGVTEEPPSNP